MLADNKLEIFNKLVSSLSNEELIWVNGFLNGLVSSKDKQVQPAIDKPAVNKMTIAYGTETGNAKKIATDLASRAKKSGINAKLISLDQYRLQDLAKEEYFFTVVSTHGDGEPPVAAKKFHDYIHHNGFKVEQLKYGVLALGDTSYPLFCKTGEEIDEQLQKLGGQRITPLRKCDVEFDEDANAWVEGVLTYVTSKQEATKPLKINGGIAVEVKKPTGKKLYTGTIAANINLNDNASEKETYHIELLADEVEYEPGDSIGIVPVNRIETVNEIIKVTGIDPAMPTKYKDATTSAFDILKTKVNVLQLTPSVVKKYASLVGESIPEGKYDLLQLLQLYPLKSKEQFIELLPQLSAIAPRIYNIASSPAAHGGEVHITVEKDHFTKGDTIQYGLCSEYLGQRVVDDELTFFVQKNKRFRLPADDTNIIMIGPGTGIAAFRSFIAERDANGAGGKNWLFFGEQHFATDFLYQTEIQNWADTGVLTKVNVAFSHDQPQQLFVHDKMLENGSELFAWMEQGAHVYVCGQKDPMSVLVEQALLRVIEQHGNKNPEEAKQYFDQLKENGRYAKDVY
jgi:sulfite reductase (NADPH) flavoprotein alpha-component